MRWETGWALSTGRPLCTCLWPAKLRALLIPTSGLAASCWRRTRYLQCTLQPVLTRAVTWPHGVDAVTRSIGNNAAGPGESGRYIDKEECLALIDLR